MNLELCKLYYSKLHFIFEVLCLTYWKETDGYDRRTYFNVFRLEYHHKDHIQKQSTIVLYLLNFRLSVKL